PVNGLDPMIRLYDSAGHLLASDDNSGSGGRNASLSYRVPTGKGGVYYAEVLASLATAKPTSGDYVLSVKGFDVALPPFAVAAVSPADGSRVRGPTTQVRIDFNDVVLLPTLQASDVRIDGVSASSITMIDGDTAVFGIAQTLSEGNHTVTI